VLRVKNRNWVKKFSQFIRNYCKLGTIENHGILIDFIMIEPIKEPLISGDTLSIFAEI